MNLYGSHSPPLAASNARVSEPDVWLTAAREQLTVSSPNTPPLGAGILYLVMFEKRRLPFSGRVSPYPNMYHKRWFLVHYPCQVCVATFSDKWRGFCRAM